MSSIIGQNKLQERLKNMKLPNLLILWGDEGSGKGMMSKAIADNNDMNYVMVVDTGVDAVRALINECIALSVPTLYYLNGDKLTIQAQNALLKLAEEPPRNAYIVIGVTNIDNLLGTIRSRAHVAIMDMYSVEELEQVFDRYELTDVCREVICNVATTPGQVIEYARGDFEEIYKYAIKVYDNILKVSTGNAFKICNPIGFKEGQGYPVEMFLEIFKQVVLTREDNVDHYVKHKMIEFTSLALRDMRIRGANKSLIFDIFILNIRSLR